MIFFFSIVKNNNRLDLTSKTSKNPKLDLLNLYVHKTNVLVWCEVKKNLNFKTLSNEKSS